jgi:hypothetical protein
MERVVPRIRDRIDVSKVNMMHATISNSCVGDTMRLMTSLIGISNSDSYVYVCRE